MPFDVKGLGFISETGKEFNLYATKTEYRILESGVGTITLDYFLFAPVAASVPKAATGSLMVLELFGTVASCCKTVVKGHAGRTIKPLQRY